MSSAITETAALETALGAITGVAPGDAAHAVDGLVPRHVATPASVEQLAAVLALANEHGAAVVPWGGGQHMSLGNVPARYDVALLTKCLDRVIEYEPADLTIAVEAGITMSALQQELAEHGQFLPIDAPPDATVGGVLAANVCGASQHAYGLPRDWLIGCKVAHVDGTISKGGGRVVKNVAGYDMPKLYVGSLGTLGVIVEATFKLAPLPAAQETLVVLHESIDSAAKLIFAADDRGLALRAVALHNREGQIEAAFWLSGTSAAVERTRRELQTLASSDSRRLEGRPSEEYWTVWSESKLTRSYAEVDRDDCAELRASLPPSACVEYMHAIDGEMTAYITTGLVLSTLRADTDALVAAIGDARRVAERLGGSLVVTSAPVDVKRRIDVWGDAGSALPLMQRLKQEFDPNATLNPGRFLRGVP
ncbi:MAG: FAD-binding oxidoreductase [Dehalococcoidia bacterium]